MFYLIYNSFAIHDFTDEDLTALLIKARKNNTASGITGMLFYFEGKFIQLIEGEEEAVKELYTRIFADPRHQHSAVLKQGTSTERFFGDWSMGFKAADPQVLLGLEGYRELVSGDGKKLPEVFKLFKLLYS
jgi:hypothetical protein